MFLPYQKDSYQRLYSDYSSGLTGLEPAASALTGRCSDRLNYNPSHMYGIHSLIISEEHSICPVAIETGIL